MAALAFVFLAATVSGWAFTQKGASIGFANLIPMGHKWVTRMAAIELMGHEPPSVPDVPDPNDPRKTWTQGLAKNTDLSSPGAQAELRRLSSSTLSMRPTAKRASLQKSCSNGFAGTVERASHRSNQAACAAADREGR